MKIEVFSDVANLVGESPSWSADEGALYWVDIVGKTIYRHGPAGLESWAAPDLACGVVPRRRGGLIASVLKDLMSFDPEAGTFSAFATIESDRPANRNNEMKCDPQGRLWLGTMQNNVAEDGSGIPITANTGALYRIGAGGETTRMLDNIGISNTLAWTPEGGQMFFADTLANRIDRFAFEPSSGALSGQESYFEGSLFGLPDGSAMDSEGYLWNARFGGGCLLRIAPDGSIDRKVDLPVTNPTSCVFGGENLDTLYITSACFELEVAKTPHEGAVLAAYPGVRGLPTHAFAG
ncbi:MAG: SMP-30/gluconolactonase/LRE family protein [Trueperaceae bacterium]|nr:MAG: SMP-30/gluconolactonase/LRE family protein [Trueperaceae bacterium]